MRKRQSMAPVDSRWRQCGLHPREYASPLYVAVRGQDAIPSESEWKPPRRQLLSNEEMNGGRNERVCSYNLTRQDTWVSPDLQIQQIYTCVLSGTSSESTILPVFL